MRCVLHIGTEKTGSTTIQDFLHANTLQLLAQGVGLCKAAGAPNNRRLAAYFSRQPDDYWRTHHLRTAADHARHFGGFLDGLRAEFARLAETCHSVVISAEHFHSRLRHPEDIAALRDFLLSCFDEVQVLVYLREQSELARSLYSTAMRSGLSNPPETMFDRIDPDDPYYNYDLFLSKWADVFGQGAIRAVLFDRAEFAGGDIRRDVVRRMLPGVDADRLDFSRPPANEALGLIRLELLRRINASLPRGQGDAQRNALRTRLVKFVAGGAGLDLGRFRNPRAAQVHAVFDASNRAFARRFLGRDDNPFPAPPADQPLRDWQGATPDAVLAATMQAVEGMLAILTGRDAFAEDDADRLRDIALNHERGTPLSRADAAYLMGKAALLRPNGQKLQRKLAEWTAAGPEG